MIITESEVEEVVLDILSEMKYKYLYGPDIAFDGKNPERESYSDVVLIERLRTAINKINAKIPQEAKEEAIKKVLRAESPSLVINNRRFHNMLVNGIDVEYRKDDRIAGDKVWLIDFNNIENNEFLAVNQFTVIENNNNRRPDVVLFINGLPLAVIELKNPADEKATVKTAFDQFQTYKAQIPSLFSFNEILIASDGCEASAGTITSKWERFLSWKTIDGVETAPKSMPQIEVVLRGMFNQRVFLDLIQHFIVFEEDIFSAAKKGSLLDKKLAAYHQYYAVNKAIEATIKASDIKGDKRCGVIWHTQGSGKSLIMVFYAGKLILTNALNNPTIVVLTDRNDLDDQLFGTFSRCNEILRQAPVQVSSREELRDCLKVAAGGIVFTTIQKFMPDEKGDRYPLLSERRNIVVIADEAHRSQYDFIDGFARHMRDALPNASFIGFTGTPIEKTDRNTRAVFGNDIDIYDIEQAVKDGATVRIYYESRLAKLELKEEEKPKIDPEFEEVTENEEPAKKEKLKTKWGRLEAIVGSEKRIRQIAKDIVAHFENRLQTIDGKAMVVCMSRRICVDLHNEIIKLRPEWYHKDDNKGFIKVIMTGSASDLVHWQEHIRTKQRRRDLAIKMKDPNDPLKFAIVRDMWLTGFDASCLKTMYIDKPMRGHGLMQTIARVNRVFKDVDGGLIVDYLGIADELKKALSEYTESGGKGKPTFDQDEAVAVMLEKYEIICSLFHKFDYERFFSASVKEKMSIMVMAEEHILNQENGKERFLENTIKLLKAFALSVPHEKALEIRDDVGFFQAVKARLVKLEAGTGKTEEELDSAIKQIISKAITSDKVVDIFEAAGIKKPDISILSDEFLAEVQGMEHKNLAVELLKKLLNDEIKTRSRKNIMKGRSFAKMLDDSIKRYHNKAIETAKIIEELIELAKVIREEGKRGESLHLSEDELAFYDALETNDSAVKVLGDEALRAIARELIKAVRNNVTIDWTLKQSIRATLRLAVKKVLKKYGYPPDKQESATQTVLKQAETICKDWEELDLFSSDAKVISLLSRIDEKLKYTEYLPVYSLAAAAGKFSESQDVQEEGWIKVDIGKKLNNKMFVAKVVGHSMEPLIPDSSYCVFSVDVVGSRQGKIVLAQYHDIHDSETGGSYTVKKYKSEKTFDQDDTWQHEKIILEPLNKNYEPIILPNIEEGEFKIIAEFMVIL